MRQGEGGAGACGLEEMCAERVSAVMPRAMVLLFAIACGVSVANVYYAQPLLDALAAEFGFSQAAVGVVVTATQVGSALALVLVVPLGDLLDRRRLTLAPCHGCITLTA